MSLNSLVDKFELITESNTTVQSFVYGDFSDVNQKKFNKYPLALLKIDEGTHNFVEDRGYYDVRLVIFDTFNKDKRDIGITQQELYTTLKTAVLEIWTGALTPPFVYDKKSAIIVLEKKLFNPLLSMCEIRATVRVGECVEPTLCAGVTVVDGDLSQHDVASGDTYTCIPSVPFKIGYQRPAITGANISVLQGDYAWHLAIGTYDNATLENATVIAQLNPLDKTKLLSNNAFGNLERYTDINGLQIYGDDYVIDQSTGFGLYILERSSDTWDNAITITDSLTLNGFSDWRIPTAGEYLTLADESLTIPLNFNPFNIGGNRVYNTNSIRQGALTDAYYFLFSAPNTIVTSTSSRTTSRAYLIIRNHH